MPKTQGKKQEHLWAVHVRGECTKHYWIIAGQSIESALKKARKFLDRLARKDDGKRREISKIKSRGTIDAF